MPLPAITAFGDGSHAPGASGVDIVGGNFGAFPLGVSIFQNEDRTGAVDALTVNSASDLLINVDIPSSLNNSAGTRFVAVQLENEDLSFSFPFTLEGEAVPGGAGLSSFHAGWFHFNHFALN